MNAAKASAPGLVVRPIPRELLFPVLPRPACRVVLVSGPPGGGKSTFVSGARGASDLVLDLDDIMAELSGLPIYRAGVEWLLPALSLRNERLQGLAHEPPDRLAYVVVCAPGAAWHWWRAALRPVRLVPRVPHVSVALARIEGDARRAHDLERHLSACRRWYDIEHGSTVKAMHKRLAHADRIEACDLGGDW